MKFIIALCVLALTGVWAAPAPNAREHQNTPLWINIPVPADELQALLPSRLKPDVYQPTGQSFVNILTYNLDKLEAWTFNSFWLNTGTTGWVTKLNILVWDQAHQRHGYLIHDIDFQNDASGAIRSLGAIVQQGLSSQLCSYTSSYSATSTNLAFKFQCLADGFSGSATYTNGPTSGPAKDFQMWIANRPTKYLWKKDGSVVYADVSYPDMNAGLNTWYPLNPSSSWTASVLSKRLRLTGNYPICQQAGICFWASYYGLIDHANTPITANINDIAVDGAILAPDDTTTTATITTTTSNNMIWLYGIVAGVGATTLIVAMVFVVMRIRARSKQLVGTTAQHVEML